MEVHPPPSAQTFTAGEGPRAEGQFITHDDGEVAAERRSNVVECDPQDNGIEMKRLGANDQDIYL